MQYDEIRVKIAGRDIDGFTNAIEVHFFNAGASYATSQFWFSRRVLRSSLLSTIRDWERSSSYVLDCNCKHMCGRYPPRTMIPSHNDPNRAIAVGGEQKCGRNRKGNIVYPCPYTSAGAKDNCHLGYEPRVGY